METTRVTNASQLPATHTRRDPIGALAAAVGACFLLCFLRTGWSPTPTTQPRALQDRIDPNRAGWFDLALLPGIGPVKAGTIVAFRKEQRVGGEGAFQVFATTADLQAVRGIGPKTVRRIAPYFRFE